MNIPNLKRVRIASVRELKAWLEKNSGDTHRVMIVTCDRSSPTKHVSRESVRGMLAGYGWKAEKSYTLNGNLVGHVISLP